MGIVIAITKTLGPLYGTEPELATMTDEELVTLAREDLVELLNDASWEVKRDG